MFKLLSAGIACLLALAAAPAQAQMSDRLTEHPAGMSRTAPKAANPDPVAVTREMTVRLRLNEGQFLKLLPLNRTRFARTNSINRQYKNDAATRVEKLSELEAQFEQECSRILTPSQLSQLQQENETPATAPTPTGSGLG